MSAEDLQAVEDRALKLARTVSPLSKQSSLDIHSKLDEVVVTLKALSLGVNQNTEGIAQLLSSNTSIHEELKQLKTENNQLRDTVSILEAKQAHTDIMLKKLQDQLLDTQTRQMRCNLIINGVPESDKENCLNKAADILTKKLKIPASRVMKPGGNSGDVSLDIAHRIGQKPTSDTESRPLVLKLVDRHSKDVILQHAKNLKGSSISISEQFPAAIRAKRASLVPDLKKARSNGDTARIAYDKLVVNGCVVPSKDRSLTTQLPLSTPSPRTTQLLSSPVSRDVKGNYFVAYAAKVTSLEDVARVQEQLWLVPQAPTADHRMWAYTLDVNGDTTTAYDCNGEYGAQGPLLRSLHDRSNTFVTVLRWAGPKLGPKRFEIIRDIASAAAESIE